MFLDDIREPKGKFDVVLRSSDEAIEYMVRNGCPNFISFDHDLGGNDTAMNVVKFMVDMDMDSDANFMPCTFNFNVHSANPVGAANIKGYLDSYLKHRVY
jgi:hypothetical protein